MIVIIIIIFICIALYEVPKLKEKKYKRELVVFWCLYIFASVLVLLYNYGIKIPSPLKAVQFFINEVLHLGYK